MPDWELQSLICLKWEVAKKAGWRAGCLWTPWKNSDADKEERAGGACILGSDRLCGARLPRYDVGAC